MTAASSRTRSAKADSVLVKAVEEARAAAVDVGSEEAVGVHLGHDAEGERVGTHYFGCELPGYLGWRWAVTVTRASRSKAVTVSECVLLPGADAVLAPAWVPWDERVKPEDLGPGDLLPVAADDYRVEPGYVTADDQDALEVIQELGLGREWVLSREGRDDAALRWFEGDTGPQTEIAKAAPGRCGSCGFSALLAGTLGHAFGVCTNERTPFDGKIVSHAHGCGGHTDVRLPAQSDETAEPVIDTLSYELVPLELDAP